MSGTSFPLVRGRALRVTKLDGCGNVVLGPNSQVVTEGFITVGLTANNDEGETIQQTNAQGVNCILDEPTPKFRNFTNEIQLCGVHPDLFSLLTGQPVVLNDAGTTAIGIDIDDSIDVDLTGFALEMWSNVAADACEGGVPEYGYFLEPFLKGGTIGDFSVENAAINFTISGAKTKGGNAWGVGPYTVELNQTGVPGPLNDALPSTRHLRMVKVAVAPPAETDGAQAVGVAATGANVTSTIQATLSPANSYAPLNLADITGHPVTATPSTAWATGKYMLMRDGTKVHWTGTAWAAGAA